MSLHKPIISAKRNEFPEGGSRSIYVIIIYLKMINQIFCH